MTDDAQLLRDARNLRDAMELIAVRVPDAISVELETSDQNEYGFVVHDVLTGGQPLSKTDPDLLLQLQDETWDSLCNISWDGVVGESPEGWHC